MLDIKAHVEKLFGELQKNLKEFPQRTESLVTETKEKVLVAYSTVEQFYFLGSLGSNATHEF